MPDQAVMTNSPLTSSSHRLVTARRDRSVQAATTGGVRAPHHEELVPMQRALQARTGQRRFDLLEIDRLDQVAVEAGGVPIGPAGMGARGRLRYNRAPGAPTVSAPPLPQIIQRESACKPPHLA